MLCIVLQQFDVQAEVLLIELQYDTRDMEAEGITVVDLSFEDCTQDPNHYRDCPRRGGGVLEGGALERARPSRST